MPDERAEALLDAALNTYPTAPLPRGFVGRTMARLAPMPRFRLGFSDLALPAFVSLFACLVVVGAPWIPSVLNPLWPSRARLALRLALVEVPAWTWALSGLVLLGSCAAIGIMVLAVSWLRVHRVSMGAVAED